MIYRILFFLIFFISSFVKASLPVRNTIEADFERTKKEMISLAHEDLNLLHEENLNMIIDNQRETLKIDIKNNIKKFNQNHNLSK